MTDNQRLGLEASLQQISDLTKKYIDLLNALADGQLRKPMARPGSETKDLTDKFWHYYLEWSFDDNDHYLEIKLYPNRDKIDWFYAKGKYICECDGRRSQTFEQASEYLKDYLKHFKIEVKK